MSGQRLTDDERAAGNNLKVAFLLNLSFTAIEIAGGLWTGSIAILTDALHDAGDATSLGISWLLQRLSRKGRTATFTYGYRRFSTLGALITGSVLIVGLIAILWQSLSRLREPGEVNARGMIALALVGIALNGFAAYRTQRGSSLNERVATWHLLEDTLGWIAVLLGSVVMAIWGVPILDPLLAIGIALFVLWNIAKQLREVLRVFLQGTPESFDLAQFERDARALPNVLGTHQVNAWSLDGERHVLSAHVVMRDNIPREDLLAVRRQLQETLAGRDFTHIALQIELAGEGCSALPDDPVKRADGEVPAQT